ncbi:hypothetical protein Z517_04844 [Fonsecaea pedrosoi CBS 271.37]|uniref:Uncharacterized protein n=1 Tax=Fonsecaea pedrosoi CBS 271.37 TaxID=1442368 RepID=A0A0D2GLJ1_9EURO|nr:uncharacterized protein Z517_04844 [Fonsecaea pedrosoi CBS 271.37]KIW81818.1 hypothetical protein Z517_04844 [Fonsecaea pedrosoi CBS 271.37]
MAPASLPENKALLPNSNTKRGSGTANDPKAAQGASDQRRDKRIFINRTLICIVVPPAILAYFIWTYLTWLRPGSNVALGTSGVVPNAQYVWWSWFVIGTFGLNISNYCLAGLEPALLDAYFARANANNEKLIYHLDKSWSTIVAWKIVVRCLWDALANCKWLRGTPASSETPAKSKKPMPSRVWVILFCLSVLSWTFVLSGLAMSVTTEFVRGQSANARVLGVNETTMNTRNPPTVLDAAYQGWRYGTPAQIPSWGSLYTESGSTLLTNSSTPNTLPADASQGIFLAPQAAMPVVGSAWGLLLKYSCTPVYHMDEFSILNYRINSTSPRYVTNYTAVPADFEFMNFGNDTAGLYYANALGNANFYYDLDILFGPWAASPSINVLSQLPTYGGDGTSLNALGFAEIGLIRGIEDLEDLSPSAGVGYSLYPFPDQDGNLQPSYNGLEDVDFLEILLWQGAYDNKISKCKSSSVAGRADINGLTGTFSDFSRADSKASYLVDVPRLGIGMPAMLLPGIRSNASYDIYNFSSLTTPLPVEYYPGGQEYKLMGTDIEWLEPLFTAADTPVELNLTGFVTYTRLMQRADLQRALEEAYKHYALALMFYGQENTVDEWPNPTLNPTVKRPILVDGGGVPPLLVLVLFSIWASGCLVLGLAYGLRKRHSATFDTLAFYHQFRELRKADREHILGLSS